MRKFRLSRLVLAATAVAAVGVLSFPVQIDGSSRETGALSSQVDWVNADEVTPWPAGSPSPSPSYDGDGESDTDGGDSSDDVAPGGPGEAGEPSSGTSGEAGDKNDSGGILGLAFPAQAGLSVGVLALAFLALLPGRKMPADLRG